MKLKINAKLNFNLSEREFLKKRNLELGGAVQQFIDREALRLSEPYIPWRTGRLTRSGQENTVIGTGIIKYNTPYAARLYYNPAFIKSLKKKDKPFKFNTIFHPMAGAYWFKRMAIAHKKELLEGAKKRAGAD
jgi:hypothetical protein